MFGILVFMFTVVPALELYLLFKIGAQIGGLNTILIIITTGIVGAALAKSQGLSILMKIQNEMNRGQLPGNQIIQGLMVFAGGLLLLTPGFMTDILGFSLVMPGPRHLLMFWVKKMIEHGMKNGNINFKTFGGGSAGGFYSYTSTEQTQQNPFEQFEQPGQQVDPKLDGEVFEAEYTKKD